MTLKNLFDTPMAIEYLYQTNEIDIELYHINWVPFTKEPTNIILETRINSIEF